MLGIAESSGESMPRPAFLSTVIVNLEKRLVEVYRQPVGTGLNAVYGSVEVYGNEAVVPVVVGGQEVADLPVADLLPGLPPPWKRNLLEPYEKARPLAVRSRARQRNRILRSDPALLPVIPPAGGGRVGGRRGRLGCRSRGGAGAGVGFEAELSGPGLDLGEALLVLGVELECGGSRGSSACRR